MCVPERVLSNDDLAQIVDTNDAWITSRTGIRERRITDSNTATSDLALIAAQNALLDAKMDASELDLILCATTTGDLIRVCGARAPQTRFFSAFTCLEESQCRSLAPRELSSPSLP